MSLQTHNNISTSNRTSRCSPSYTQFEKLLEILESKRWLANGYARTEIARNRSRLAWEEVAITLNSQCNGRVRTGPQWAKYWKDKKAAIKKKARDLSADDGVVNEDVQLNELEERVVTLSGFSKGDQVLEIDPLNGKKHNIEISSRTDGVDHQIKVLSGAPKTEDEQTRTEFSTPESSEAEDEAQGAEPEPIKEERDQDNKFQAIDAPTYYAPRRPVRPRSVYAPSQRLRQRPLRPIPSQRRSDIESMSERILAIEERRVETEHLQARTQHMLAKNALLQTRTQQILTESLDNHNRTIHDIGNNLISVLEKFLSNRSH